MPEKIFSTSKKWSVIHVLLIGAVLFLVGFFAIQPETVSAEKSKGDDGIAQCAQCHDDVAAAFAGNAHKGLGAVCTDCHGNAEKHMAEGGAIETIVTYKGKETALKDSAKCLVCHKNTTGEYMSSPHGKSSFACTECHTIHGKVPEKHLLKVPAKKLCSTCHQDVYAQFNMNERHRLQEGILDCSNCHDVHAPATRERLGGFKQETCLKCHIDKGGPFMYEHEAVTIEGCNACHEPHGSPNRHMLKNQTVGDLCFSCHTGAPSWHSRFSATPTNCVSCHTSIHGSNLDKLFLK